MEENLTCPVFGYTNIVRFSWKPAKTALENGAKAVVFEADLDRDEHEQDLSLKIQQNQMSSFLNKEAPTKKRKRFAYFERRGLSKVCAL